MDLEELKNKYPAQKPMTDKEAEMYLNDIIEHGQLHGMSERSIVALRHIKGKVEKLKYIERLEIGDVEK